MQDVIRMTYDVALCHPDAITKIWSLSHPDDLAITSISSGWLIVDALCHPDDLPGVGISSGWVTANSLCHPDDILFHFMSSGWLNWGWFLIRMSYGNVIMSSGWDALPFLSHPDEIANFDFPQHAVALQRFRKWASNVLRVLGQCRIASHSGPRECTSLRFKFSTGNFIHKIYFKISSYGYGHAPTVLRRTNGPGNPDKTACWAPITTSEVPIVACVHNTGVGV